MYPQRNSPTNQPQPTDWCYNTLWLIHRYSETLNKHVLHLTDVQDSNREYFIYADTATEAEEWLKAILMSVAALANSNNNNNNNNNVYPTATARWLPTNQLWFVTSKRPLSPSPANSMEYVVQPYETLTGIALKFNLRYVVAFPTKRTDLRFGLFLARRPNKADFQFTVVTVLILFFLLQCARYQKCK